MGNDQKIEMKIAGLFASFAQARLICGGQQGSEAACQATCREGGMHWSISDTTFEKYNENFHGERCRPELNNGRYELTVPFGPCGLKRKVWWKDRTIHYLFTATYFNGQGYDTLHLTCSHHFERGWYQNEYESMEWVEKTKPVHALSSHISNAVNVNLKSSSTNQELHTLSVLSPPRGVGDRLVFAIVQQLTLPDKYFKVTDCDVHSSIDGEEFSFPILRNEVGNHLVEFRFEGENQDIKQVVMSFKTFYFKNGTGNQTIKCKVLTCDGPCDEVSHKTPDESLGVIMADAQTLTIGLEKVLLKPFYAKLTKVANHMKLIRQKLENHCAQEPFQDTRSITRMSSFDGSNTCPEMALIADELMSWATIYNRDCRRDQRQQTRLAKMHFQLSRAFEYFTRKFC